MVKTIIRLHRAGQPVVGPAGRTHHPPGHADARRLDPVPDANRNCATCKDRLKPSCPTSRQLVEVVLSVAGNCRTSTRPPSTSRSKQVKPPAYTFYHGDIASTD